MTKANNSLHRAKKNKNDEFYTQYDDIKKSCLIMRGILKTKLYIVIVTTIMVLA